MMNSKDILKYTKIASLERICAYEAEVKQNYIPFSDEGDEDEGGDGHDGVSCTVVLSSSRSFPSVSFVVHFLELTKWRASEAMTSLPQ